MGILAVQIILLYKLMLKMEMLLKRLLEKGCQIIRIVVKPGGCRKHGNIRAQTIQRIHELVAQQRAWCSENSVRYEKLLQSFGEKLQAARDVLRETDLSGFEEMLCSLDRLDEELDK